MAADPLQKKSIPPFPFLALAGLAAVAAVGWWFLQGRHDGSALASEPVGAVAAKATTGPAQPSTSAEPVAAAAGDLESRIRALVKSGASPEEILALIQELARTRPALAIELAQALGRNEEERAEWVSAVMRGWADRDPGQAWSWLKQQAHRMDDLANGSLGQVVFDGMAKKDPKLLISSVNDIFRDGRQPPAQSIAPLVASHLAMQAMVNAGQVDAARQAIEDWARGGNKIEIGAAPMETVAMAMGQKEPEAAGSWLRSLPQTEDRNHAIATYASDWCNRDADGAMKWVESLKPQEGRSDAIERTFADWVERDATKAATWLGDFLNRSDGTAEADKMIAGLIHGSSTVRRDPATAIHWASLITNDQQRGKVTEGVALRWARQDLSGATNFVMKNDSIPTERKQALIDELRKVNASKDDYLDE